MGHISCTFSVEIATMNLPHEQLFSITVDPWIQYNWILDTLLGQITLNIDNYYWGGLIGALA